MNEMPPWIGALCRARKQIQDNDRKIADDPGRRISRPKESVVNSPDVTWKPIDKTAAFVISTAPWWAKAPYEKPKITASESKSSDSVQTRNGKEKMEDRNTIPRKKKEHNHMILKQDPSREPYREGSVRTYLGPDGEDMIKIEELVPRIIAEINKQPQQLTSLARAAFDARTVMNENIEKIGTVMEEFNARSKALLEDIRGTRFSVVSEVSQMLKPLSELRQFFLGKDYDAEIQRLREFTELCERLAALKSNGALDAIADTMVKLAVS